MIWEDMNPRYKEMYIQQYEVDMPEIVNKLAPHISYWPSSPSAFGKMQDTERMRIMEILTTGRFGMGKNLLLITEIRFQDSIRSLAYSHFRV